MVRCSVEGCKPPDGAKVHRFPKEKERWDIWMRNAKIPSDKKDPRICDLHFTEEQFEIDKKVRTSLL